MDPFIFNERPGSTAIAAGKEYLFFSGYAYLGMQHVPAFTALIKEGIDKYGWLFPSSRISNTQLYLFKECEALLSSITGFEDSVLLSSGFLAGRCATELWKDEIINLVPSHPAIKRKNTAIESSNKKIFAVDSVNMLTAVVTNFSFASNANIPTMIIVDDSHGIGLIGENGEGICRDLPTNKNVSYVLSYSLSKAWNINAGAISCSKNIADRLRKLPAYAAGTAPSPAILYAFMQGQHLYAMQREKLKNNISHFQSLIKPIHQIIHHPQLPVFILPASMAEIKLKEKNIIISSFAYPDPSGVKYDRIVINALHSFADLEYLASCLTAIFV